MYQIEKEFERADALATVSQYSRTFLKTFSASKIGIQHGKKRYYLGILKLLTCLAGTDKPLITTASSQNRLRFSLSGTSGIRFVSALVKLTAQKIQMHH